MTTTTDLTEAEGAAKIAAQPELFTPIPDDEREPHYLALPPGWTATKVDPTEDTPRRQIGTSYVLTADGFVSLVDQLSSYSGEASDRPAEQAPRLLSDTKALTAIINPGNLADPTFEDLKVVLRPETSVELRDWLDAAAKQFDLNAWPRFVEDHQADIDTAAESEATAPGFLDVLGDARTWNVTARRAVRRVQTELSESDDKDEYVAKIEGEALASFKIRLPLLAHSEPVTLTVRIDRDLEQQRITPRLPGIQRAIDAAVLAEITRAETALGLDVIR